MIQDFLGYLQKKNDPLIDLEENVYSLNIERNTISNLVLIDIFHHMQSKDAAIKIRF